MAKKRKTTADLMAQREEHRLIAWKREREIRDLIRKSMDQVLDEATTDSLIDASRMVAEIVKYDEGFACGLSNGRNERR